MSEPTRTPIDWQAVSRRVLMALGLMVAVTVAIVTGRMSWFHIVHVGVMVGEPDARLLPVPVDGMMLTGTVMIGVDRLLGREPRIWATIGLWVGASFTLSMNVASAWERGWWARLVALIPAITLVITVETIFRPSRRALKAIREAIVAQAMAVVAPVVQAVTTVTPEPATVEPEPTPVVEPEPEPTPTVVEPEPVAEPVKAPRRRGGGSPRGPRVKRITPTPVVDEESATVESEPPQVVEVMAAPVDTDRPAVPVAAFIAA